MITLIVILVIVIGIISISLKISESKDIKPPQSYIQSFSQELTNNSNDMEYDEEQYHHLTNTLSIHNSTTLVNEQQIARTYSSAEVIKYVIYQGEQFSVRSKVLKICNKNVKNLTDIHGYFLLQSGQQYYLLEQVF